MELQTLKVTTREEHGKGAARRTRRAGNIPAILYGLGTEPVSLKVDVRELDLLLRGDQGAHALVDLEVEGNPDLSGPAILKEVQRHPIRGNTVHADLLRIDLTHKIHTLVSIKLEGVCPGVIEGGVIDYQIREIEVLCLPLEVPDAIMGDISVLNIGDSMHVNDLVAPDNVEILTPGDRAVVAVHAPRVILEAEPAEGEEEPIEGEEEEAAEADSEASSEGGKDEKKADE